MKCRISGNQSPRSSMVLLALTCKFKGLFELCNFQQCGILTSVDSEEHAQPPFRLTKLQMMFVSSLTVVEYSSH